MKIDDLYPEYIFCFNHCLIIRHYNDAAGPCDYLVCSSEFFKTSMKYLDLDMDDDYLENTMKRKVIFLDAGFDYPSTIAIIDHGVLKTRIYDKIKDSKGNIIKNTSIFFNNLENDDEHTCVVTNVINGNSYKNIIDSEGNVLIDKWLTDSELHDGIPKDVEHSWIIICYKNGKILAKPYRNVDTMLGEVEITPDGKILKDTFKKY